MTQPWPQRSWRLSLSLSQDVALSPRAAGRRESCSLGPPKAPSLLFIRLAASPPPSPEVHTGRLAAASQGLERQDNRLPGPQEGAQQLAEKAKTVADSSSLSGLKQLI